MSSDRASLFFHPVRLQIIAAISSQRMTVAELSALLPDVPQTSLYRHINTLVEGGILKIAGEKQVRGTVERTYQLSGLPSLQPADLRSLTRRDLQQALTVYLSTLMSSASRYIEGKKDDAPINPLEDGVDLSLGHLFLTDEEFRAVNARIMEIVSEARRKEPAPGRKRRLFSYLFIPQ